MADKTMIGIRVAPDLERRFEEFREERGLSKSDAGRRLLDRGLQATASEEEESEDSNPPEDGRDGYLTQLLPSAVTAFLAAALVLAALGHPNGAAVSGAVAALAAVVMQGDVRDDLPGVVEGTDSALDAQKSLLRGYVSLTALGLIFGGLAWIGSLVLAGLAEVVGLVVAAWLLKRSLSSDRLTEFARARLVELGLFVGGFVGIFAVAAAGAPETYAVLPVIALVVGWLSISWSTIGIIRELASTAGDSPTPDDNGVSQ